MEQTGKSLRQKQRTILLDAYRGRGRRNNNLWLVYSVKTNRDWILPSDRQLVHWIHYLETNRVVASFDLTPEPINSSDCDKTRCTELDATVRNADDSAEWHEVKSAESEKEAARSQFLAQSSAAAVAGIRYRVFTDNDLKPHVRTSIRWLRAIGYATSLRDQEQIPATLALIGALKLKHVGIIGDLVSGLPGFDPAVLLGLLARQAIQGHVEIDLDTCSFGYATRWRYLRS